MCFARWHLLGSRSSYRPQLSALKPLHLSAAAPAPGWRITLIVCRHQLYYHIHPCHVLVTQASLIMRYQVDIVVWRLRAIRLQVPDRLWSHWPAW